MQTTIVTGAAGGIGQAIVLRLAKEGRGILATDKDPAALTALAKLMSKRYPAIPFQTEAFDLTNRKATEKFLGRAARIDDLHGLVNNAGIYLGKDLFDYTLAEMDQVLAVNLFSAIQITQGVGKALAKKKRAGAIVNVSSISAFEGSSDALYGISKAGLIGLTRSSALTFAPLVRVNAVAPGLVDTSLIKAIPKWRLAEFEKGERLKGRISPEAVASAVWFLLSDESRHTTGSVIDLNNGGYFR